jgi:pyridoxine 4-dehydrogenase
LSAGTGRLNGRSEQLLGRFIREYPGTAATRNNIAVATKLAAYPWRVTPGNMVAALRGSLRRLGEEQVAVAQLHWSAAKYAPLQVRRRSLLAALPVVLGAIGGYCRLDLAV